MNDQPNAKPNPAVQANRGPKLLLWLTLFVVSVLGLLATLAAIRDNPLYTGAEANGMSMYHFLERCKREFERGPELALIRQEQPELEIFPIYDPISLVEAAAPKDGGGWEMTTNFWLKGRGLPRAEFFLNCDFERGGQVRTTLLN